MLREIHLYGALAEEFGDVHHFAVDSVGEAVQALSANFPRFNNAVRDGYYRVIVGESTTDGVEIEMEMLPGMKLGNQALHLLPVPEGAKRGGLGKIIAGIALIGLSAMTGGAAGALMTQALWGSTTVGSLVGSIGTSMLLTGVASLIAPQQDVKGDDDDKSFTMSGPVNSTREGSIVPIVYGEVITGGMMISGGLTIGNENGTGGGGGSVGNALTDLFRSASWTT